MRLCGISVATPSLGGTLLFRLYCQNFSLSSQLTYTQVLRVHQEEEQQVVFEEGQEDLVTENQRLTELTEFFEHNKNVGPEEWLQYVDMPKKYTWNKQKKAWKKHVYKSDTIGRVDNVHPAAGDSFYL